MSYSPQNPNGQATKANSSPVTLASDQNNALESSGNLATIVANQTNATQQTKLTNGFTTASISSEGALSASIDPSFEFIDNFDGTTIDITNRWTSGGTVAPTQNGAALINPGSTSNATTALASQPTFTPGSNTSFGVYIMLEATTIATGNYRFWGYGTAPSGVGTAAAPLQNAIGFELDTTGTLRTSVYSGGVRTFTQTQTVPVDGAAHLYVITLGNGTAFFYKDTFTTPLAFTQISPVIQTLPVRLVSLNSGLVTSTPTMSATTAAIADFAHQAQSISDGTYFWRKATVNNSGQLSVASNVPVGTALNTYESHITNNATTAITAATAYISTITIAVVTASATGTITIQDASGTPLKLINLLPTTALTSAPDIYNFQVPIEMTNGISVVTAAGTAGTINVWISYWQ